MLAIRVAILIRRFAAAFAGLALAASMSGATITVLHTSDLHGHVHPQDELAERDFGEGLARVAAAVRAARAEGRPLLLLDSGDSIQGAPAQALVFSGAIPDTGDPTVRAMNLAGYDAMAVGNHEFDFGLARLTKSRREARFPWLSANIVGGDGKPAFAPFIVKTMAGARIGILGLTTQTVPAWEPAAHIGGLRFLDTLETAKRYVPILRGRERCDIVLVITHQGFERDLDTGKENVGAAGENRAYAIATGVPGIDLLLTGHTHTAIEPRKLNQTWVSQPGRYGNTLTRFDLTLEKAGSHWKVTSVEGRNLSMTGVMPDPEIVKSVAAEQAATARILSEVVATLEQPVSARSARTSDTGLLDWLHAVQRREGRAELSFASLLPGSLPDWPSGPLTIRQIWAFYPYENKLVTVRATGKQVREALEDAARCISGISIQDSKPVWQRNPAVWGYNCDTLEGAEYVIDPTRPEGSRVVFVKRDGRPLRDEETFTVAINSYRASGGGGFGVWRDCPRMGDPTGSLRDLLIADARNRKTLRLEPNQNWFLSPGLPEGRFSTIP